MCQSMLSLNAGNVRQKQVTSNCYAKYPVNVQNTSLDLEKQQKKGKKKGETNKNAFKYLIYLFAKTTTFLDFLLSGYNGKKLRWRAAVGNPLEYNIFRAK